MKSVSYMKDSIAKEKNGAKKCLEISAMGGTLCAALLEWYQTAQTPEKLARGSRPGR